MLDGGLRKWTERGHTVESGNVDPIPTTFTGTPRPDMWADKQQVTAALHSRTSATLVNAIPALPADTSALPEEAVRVMTTTIPGSVDVPYPAMADASTSMLRTAAEREACLAPVNRGKASIIYCNSGLNAPLVGFSLLAAGHSDVSIYDGSLEEWLQDPDAPVEPRGFLLRSPFGRSRQA